MKYYWKCYLWKDGQPNTDFSNNLISPIFYEDKLNEELDTGEIILDKMPLNSRYLFQPKTKIRLELRIEDDGEKPYKKYDVVVDHDDVDFSPGCPEYLCHRIYVTEPSVIAQGIHVDNIALTYELQDVTLNYKVIRNPEDIVTIRDFPGGGGRKEYEYFNRLVYKSGEYNRTTSFSYEWDDLDSMSKILLEIDGSIPKTINFQLPRLSCYHLNGEQKTYLFEVPTKCEIFKIEVNNGVADENSKKLVFTQTFNPITASNRNDNIMFNNGRVGIRNYLDEKYTYLKPVVGGEIEVFKYETYSTFPSIINLKDTTHTSKNVAYTTETLTLEEMAANKSLRYQIKISANPYEKDSLITYFNKKAVIGEEYSTSVDWAAYIFTFMFGGTLQKRKDVNVFTNSIELIQPNNVYVETVFNCLDLSNDVPPSPFILKGVKYSCYELFRKAMLTCDSYILDNTKFGLDQNDGIQFPIEIDDSWIDRMKLAPCYETIFEQKNLWEVLLQIGYYLHAIPYLEFSESGKDCFVLKFKQLGSTLEKKDNTQKITIFNSCNLSEFFSSLDSYVENLFSPQNIIEEWVVPKTTDNTYLISNNTAELHLKYPITELLAFDITYDAVQNGNMGISGTKSALDRVFEKSIYNILSNQYSRNSAQRIKPAKGTSLYYELGNNKILGLNYVPPTQNDDGLMALKDIITDLFQGKDEHWDVSKIKFNDLIFHIKYRTQDSLRITQTRPDLTKYMKNSKYEKYPHHEQYYGTQDKIIDSERFSANLWGRLIRMGNNIYQCQEYVKDITTMKESGDLINLADGPYYVTEVENEFYSDSIFQKVTYSKNYNQISQVVTIPSEPRFYEISERTKIRREVRMFDFFTLSNELKNTNKVPKFVNKDKWKGLIKHILFNFPFEDFPNYAWTRFKADKFRLHVDTSGQVISPDKLFPSCEIIRNNDNTVEPKASSDHADIITPLLHTPMKNSIIFEWDMADNFKAGDAVDESIYGGTDIDNAYLSMQPIRYCDILGRADLFSFKLFNKRDWRKEQLQLIPKGTMNPNEEDCLICLPDNLAIGLDKDNREEMSFNYQINLLTNVKEGDVEDFITFPNLFGEKKGILKMCFLNKTVSMFDESVSLSTNIIVDNVDYSVVDTQNGIELTIEPPSNLEVDNVKSIVLYDVENEIKYAYLAKNVSKLTNGEKFANWYIYPEYAD